VPKELQSAAALVKQKYVTDARRGHKHPTNVLKVATFSTAVDWQQ